MCFGTLEVATQTNQVHPQLRISNSILDHRLPPEPTMPVTIISYETRKPNLTPSNFAKYYDDTHVPIMKAAMGSSFPSSHARYYVKRQPDSVCPMVFIGSPAKVDYDAVVIMTFNDQQHLEDFQTKYGQPEIAQPIWESAENFIVSSELVVVGMEDPHVTCA